MMTPLTSKDIQRAARPIVKPIRKSRKHPVTTVTVDSRVWALARELAGGDASRLTIVSATEVLVANQ